MTGPVPGPRDPGMQGVGWLVIRVADLDGTIPFYRDVLGLPLVRGKEGVFAMFGLGNGTLLELSASGTPGPVPADRREAKVTAVFRVYGFDAWVARLDAHGVRFLEREQTIPGGRLAWFLDPDGTVLAIQERTLESTRPEDASLRAAWEQSSAG